MRLLLPLLAVLLAGCPKDQPVESTVTTADLASPPRLPSPTAGTYARVVKAPKDPVVRAVLGDRTWDESLAGAAAGLALGATSERSGFNRREIRQAAWNAGYAWPVLALGTWPTSEAGAPPPGVRAWLQEQPADRDIGLVRARGGGKDLWVGLAGTALIDLGIVPREVASGTSLTLPARPGATWRTSDGLGRMAEGPLDAAHDVVFDAPGEWVVQISDRGGDLARFVVYVDEEAAKTPVLPPRNVSIVDKQEAIARIQELVTRAREEYRAPSVIFDPLLDKAAADARAKDLDPAAQARTLSGSPETAVGGRCVAGSVEDCIDQLLWNPRSRRAFVEGKPWAMGFDVAWTPERVDIIAVMVAS